MVDTAKLADIAAERALLGSVMLSAQAYAETAWQVAPEDFQRGAHRTVWETVGDMRRDGREVDTVTVHDELARRGWLDAVGGAAGLTDLAAATPSAASAKRYARIVADLGRRRRIAQAGYDLSARAADPSEDIDAAVAAASDQLAGSVSQTPTVPAHTLVERAMVSAARGAEQMGWPAPWPALRTVWRIVPGWVHIAVGFRSAGKALALNTTLPTSDGWTTMGDVRPGDRLLDERGKPCRVTAVTDVMHGHECYRVRFSDGTEVVADAEHEWLTSTSAARSSERRQRRREGRRAASDQRGKCVQPSTVTTEQIAATLTTTDGANNHAVRLAEPLSLPHADLPADPYVLGAWLGDGDSHSARLTYAEADAEIIDRIAATGTAVGAQQKIAGREHVAVATLGKADPGTCARNHRVTRTGPPASRSRRCPKCDRIVGQARRDGTPLAREPNRSLQTELRDLGVLGNKHIPRVYLRASAEQRTSLLEGLMDTDGSAGDGGQCEFTSTNRTLAEGVHELIVSLGYRAALRTGRATVNGRDVGEKCRIVFTPDRPVFRLARKLARQKIGTHEKAEFRYIESVEPVESVPVRCVQVDSPSSLYLCTGSMVPTHNSAFVDALVAGLSYAHNTRTLMWSPEGAPSGDHLLRMAKINAGAAIETWPDDALRRELASVTDRVSWIDHETHTTVPAILAAADAHRMLYGLDMLVVDPFTSVAKFDGGQDEGWDRVLNRHLSRLQTWARSRQVAVVMVAHPKQRDRITVPVDGRPPASVRPVPTDADIAGGAMWGNQVDSLVAVWRDEQGQTRPAERIDVYVQKVREDGPGGKMGARASLWRDQWGRYHAVDDRFAGAGSPAGNGQHTPL